MKMRMFYLTLIVLFMASCQKKSKVNIEILNDNSICLSIKSESNSEYKRYYSSELLLYKTEFLHNNKSYYSINFLGDKYIYNEVYNDRFLDTACISYPKFEVINSDDSIIEFQMYLYDFPLLHLSFVFDKIDSSNTRYYNHKFNPRDNYYQIEARKDYKKFVIYYLDSTHNNILKKQEIFFDSILNSKFVVNHSDKDLYQYKR